ncbi:MAG: hypothetical protein NWQ31_07895, partial [Polaribacter sp.]|nr:hypothetical protein [Polaribacter sp.]
MKTNYIGYIKLQKTSQKQFLYTTSSGGGFFNIYVNFDVVDNIIKNISLFIKNYKGTKYYFKEKYLEITKSHDSALRIAAALTKYGSGRSIK